ncbi:class I SAM-dependent methyltransferase [Gorillibacterium massiliense]|uniref:class I SAM-dependent methyltransferase n=1 Tax=Gorillibacterium massiliense TaxID=1280390 RepID=UPI0004B7C488|nr:class I SAM-dependent methyltransferase [Gorillibacterium massiliense]
MNASEYKAFYDEVGVANGWDFSRVKCMTEGTNWDFYTEVTKTCAKTDLLLDIGTGGGEKILSIADSALLLVGIDQSSGMIETAKRNAARPDIRNVRFFQMEAEELEFPEAFFDVVSCRHSGFQASEIARVLKKGGSFLTQQVSENDKRNLKEAFGRGQAWGEADGAMMGRYVAELKEAGFAEIQTFEFDDTEYYETAEDLIFLLKHTPIIPGFGSSERDFHILRQFVTEHQTEKGVRTNAARFVITARL